MSEQEIVVTESDHSVAARESQKDTSTAAEQPKPQAEQEAPQKVEASDAADEGDDGEETQNESGESAASGSDEHAKPKNRGVGKRIDELTKARYDAERERDHWREMAMRGSQTQPDSKPQPAPAVAKPDAEPTLESCDFDTAEFQKKWYDWRRGQERAEEQAKKAQEEKQQKYRTFAEREAAFIAANPDYEQVAKAPHVPITPEVAELVLDADDPPAVAYYLGKNIEEATAIAQMTPVNAARAIGRIEAKLSAPTAASDPQRQPQPKSVTKAPPPVTTLTGAASVRKSYDDMTQEEYEQARREERRAKGLAP